MDLYFNDIYLITNNISFDATVTPQDEQDLVIISVLLISK